MSEQDGSEPGQRRSRRESADDASDPQDLTRRAVPYLAGAAGAILAAVLVVGAWLNAVMVIELFRGGDVLTEALDQVAVMLALTALIASFAAYVFGIPAAVAIEWALRRVSAHAAGRLRYVAYLLAGLLSGLVAGVFLTSSLPAAAPVAALGGGAAVVGAATMRMARQRARLARRLAIAVPAGLVVIGLVLPTG